MKYIFKITLSLLFCVSYLSIANAEQINTQTPAGQLMFHYDNDNSAAFITVTNTSVAESVNIHVQILDSTCTEVNFYDKLTPADTHTYDMDDIRQDCFDPNDDAGPNVLCEDQNRASGANADNKKGMVFITAVSAVNTPDPIAFPNLIGSVTLFGSGYATAINAVGRNFDGAGFEQLSDTTQFLAAFSKDDAADEAEELDDVILTGLAWADSFDAPRPGYQPISSTADGVLDIRDEFEVPLSCDVTGFECIGYGAPTAAFESSPLCGESNIASGLFDMFNAVVPANAVMIETVVIDDKIAAAGADYVIHVAALDTTTPVEDCSDGEDNDGDEATDCDDTDCFSDAGCIAQECQDVATDCAKDICDGQTIDGATCNSDGTASEDNCNDGIDNDGDGGADCKDPQDCALAANCIEQGGSGGGGGGCSVATAATGLGSMANALVLLIPAFGIGARRIRQRLNK